MEQEQKQDWPELRYDDQERHINNIQETDDEVIISFAKHHDDEEEMEMEESSEEMEMSERPGKEEERPYHDEDDRMIETGQLSRIFDLDRSAIDEENRTVSVIFSTETPVDRNFGVEILDHDRGSVRMDQTSEKGTCFVEPQYV